MSDEKTCPYCAETIKAAAIKCKHCGEFLAKSKDFKFNRATVVSGVSDFAEWKKLSSDSDQQPKFSGMCSKCGQEVQFTEREISLGKAVTDIGSLFAERGLKNGLRSVAESILKDDEEAYNGVSCPRCRGDNSICMKCLTIQEKTDDYCESCGAFLGV